MYPKGDVPQWVVDALDVAGINLDSVTAVRPAHKFYEEVQSMQPIARV